MIYLYSLLLSLVTSILLYNFVSKYVDTTSTNIYFILLVMYFILFWMIVFKLFSNKKIIISKSLKILYIITIVLTLFFRMPTELASYNFKPLFLDPYLMIDFVFLFNMILFIPLPILFKIKWYYVISGFILIELLQYFLHVGSFDINDIILYVVGYIIGLICVKIYNKKTSQK